MPVMIAHNYDERLAGKIAAVLPEGVDFRALGANAETGWEVSAEAEILLINQNSPEIGLHRGMVKPDGWPFNLKWVQLRSTGIDKYPDWIFEVPQVCVTRGGYAVPISEYVLAAMLAQVKLIPEIWVRGAGQWQPRPRLGTLNGQTLGIIGFGEIGKAIAEKAQTFGMEIIGTRRSGGPSGMEGVEIVSLGELISRSDHIVVATPLTEETAGMLNVETLAGIKDGAHLINIGRGQVITEDGLRAALDGKLGAATLDVTVPEPLTDGHWLYSHPKVRISPHISGSSPQSDANITAFFRRNLDRYLAGERLEGLVDPLARY
ncbi:NAD(P)-dependent oxidoreductase [Devosia sp. SD17-2]|uniref:NAD(P)-dependent oxidoreductase n=1 Tax=Devosia sp. SD17-2 TaxID=2976459 RepID=UPI0023D8C69A|nr:NAD(P)-dependent oxidoreductase [Devosia sp. SD17-2]WEJ34621.1 hydroxyacid dehydrogenase [Devosia sp. SD17-2]